jgi:hypothetical protein
MNQPDLFGAVHVQSGSSIVPRDHRGHAVGDRAALARELRDVGIRRAAEHAESKVPTWNERAFGYLLEFAAGKRQGDRFQSEDVRQLAEGKGFPVPPDKRAWGAIMLRGARAGIMTKIGWAPASDPKVHCNPVSLWEVK